MKPHIVSRHGPEAKRETERQSVDRAKRLLKRHKEQNTKLRKLVKLTAVWKKETRYSSSHCYEHPAYQEIIRLGKDVVPVLLEQLEESPEWWFHALRTILKDGPVIPPNAQGRLDELAKLWVAWGKQHGWVA